MRNVCLVLLAASWLPVSWLPAQRRFVVDASGSGQFTDLPQALATARDGDVFDVLPGDYTPTWVTAGVSIVGRPGCRMRAGLFVVDGIGPQATFALTDFEGADFSHPVEFQVRGCTGPVIFQRLSPVRHLIFNGWTELMLRVGDSTAVFSQECHWIGDSPVEVLGPTSRLTLSHSTAEGFGPFALNTQIGAFGLRIADGHVDLVESTVLGAEGERLGVRHGGFGLSVDGGSLRAARSLVRGGTSWAFISSWLEPAFLLSRNAQVVLDPTASYEPVSRVIGQGSVVRRTVPAISASSVAVGGTVAATWSGALGATSIAAISLAAPAVATPFGFLLLDGPTTTGFYFGPAITTLPTFTLPASTPTGIAVVLQGAVDGPNGLELTMGQAFVVR